MDIKTSRFNRATDAFSTSFSPGSCISWGWSGSCSGPQAALKRVEQGFSFVSAGGDIFMLAQAAKNSVAAFREGQRVAAAAETV